MSVLTREGFHALQAQAADALARSKSALTVLICAGTGCIASGSMKVYENLRTECQERGLTCRTGLFQRRGSRPWRCTPPDPRHRWHRSP